MKLKKFLKTSLILALGTNALAQTKNPLDFLNSREDPTITPHIINGVVARPTEFPFIAALYSPNSDPVWSQFCGGTLIAPNKILTAAHCVDDKLTTDIEVVVGRSTLSESDGEIRSIKGIAVHPLYNDKLLTNDVAILTLSEEITNITPIPVVSDQDLEYWKPGSKYGTIVGWGQTEPELKVYPDNLRKTTIPIVNDTTCKNTMGIMFDTATMICGGIKSSSKADIDGVGPCYGDSGGPLIVNTPEGRKIAGITSWGYECASSRTYSVFSRVGTLNSWINSNPESRPEIFTSGYISGESKVGETLTCNAGSYAGDNNVYQYEWVKETSINGSSIYEYTDNYNPTYTIQKNDVNSKIHCLIGITNNGGSIFDIIRSENIVVDNVVIKADTLLPSINSHKVSCQKRKCTVKLTTSDNTEIDNISAVFGNAFFKKKGSKNNKLTVSSFQAQKIGADIWKINLKKVKSAGTYTLEVNATDKAGNTTTSPYKVKIKVK